MAASRRSFLKYAGAVTGAALTHGVLGPLGCAGSKRGTPGWVLPDGRPAWQALRYPIPLPGDRGAPGEDALRLATFEVHDDLLLPEGFTYEVLAQWGDRFGPEGKQITFGTSADYTGLIPVHGTADQFWMIVNHEYISARPWLQGFDSVHGESPVDSDGKIGNVTVVGADLDLLDPELVATLDPSAVLGIRRLCTAAMEDLGISILRVRRRADDGFEVLESSPDHFRICGASCHNTGGAAKRFTGPAAPLLGRPRGTFSNCSGAVTPWGTFLTCEENFQDQVPELITPSGMVLPEARKNFTGRDEEGGPRTLPIEFEGLGTGLERPLDGRHYGWVCEIDPVNRTMKKHTALGRFRHENVALRVEKGRRLVAYMGDDRRGGHVWKFVSDGVVENPEYPGNSALLEHGTLHVARFEPEPSLRGRWIPIRPDTLLVRPEPEQCAMGHMWLPGRPAGGQAFVSSVTCDEWLAAVEAFAGKPLGRITLGDLVRGEAQGVLMLDAYVMANCAGGTPCARPEDLEIHSDGSIYLALTDATGNADGSPDKRVFPDSAGKNSRQYGAIYRIEEDRNDPAAVTFRWGKFVPSGEAHEQGGGFACADNLLFDPLENLWMVCDITSSAHNTAVRRTEATAPGAKQFMGIFGNNSMFMIPTAGSHAGVPFCFAIGPMECELTGPTFTRDGRSLLVSIQHPGELWGTRGVSGNLEVVRDLKIADRAGSVFTQERVVPLGSNYPSKKLGDVPRSCVVCIRRTRPASRADVNLP